MIDSIDHQMVTAQLKVIYNNLVNHKCSKLQKHLEWMVKKLANSKDQLYSTRYKLSTEDNLGYTTRFKEIVKFGREKRFKLAMKSSSLSGSMEDEISFHL